MKLAQRKNSQQKPADHLVVTLMVSVNGDPVDTITTTEKRLIIGRSVEADLPIDDSFISGKHCLIEMIDNHLYVNDLASRNGTHLNGISVECASEVFDGDTIVLGHSRVKIKLNSLNGADKTEVTAADLDQTHERGPEIINNQTMKTINAASDLRTDMIEQGSNQYGEFNGPTTSAMPKKTAKKKSAKAKPVEVIEEFDEQTADYFPHAYDEAAEEDFDLADESHFNLLKNINAPLSGNHRKPEGLYVEILKTLKNEVLTSDAYRPGKKITLHTDQGKLKIGKIRQQHFDFVPVPGSKGFVIKNGKKTNFDAFAAQNKNGSIPLQINEQACFYQGDIRYIMRVLPQTEVPKEPFKIAFDDEIKKIIVGCLAVHLFLVLAVGVISFFHDKRMIERQKELDRFVKMDIAKPKPEVKLEIVKPEVKPPPVKEKPKVAKKKPKKKKKVAKKTPKKKRKVVKKKPTRLKTKKVAKKSGTPAKKRTKKAGSPKPKRNVAKAGVLGALGGLAVNKNNRVASAVTNLKAVKAKGGAQTFSVSGLQGKLKNDDVSIQRVGDLKTKGASSLGNRSYGVASISNKKGSGFGVAATVSGSDAIVTPKAQNGLTPGQVKAIIDKNMWQLNNCYEKGLAQNPSLQGKMNIEFGISGSGPVTSVRIAKSDLRSATVNGCITKNIRSWKFPKGKNGYPTDVRFPSVFSPSAF